ARKCSPLFGAAIYTVSPIWVTAHIARNFHGMHTRVPYQLATHAPLQWLGVRLNRLFCFRHPATPGQRNSREGSGNHGNHYATTSRDAPASCRSTESPGSSHTAHHPHCSAH